MNKKNYIRIIAIFAVIFVILWAVCNLTSLRTVFSKILSILVPIIAGGCIAFILNIPLRLLERLWIKLFSNKHKGLRRAVCILLCIIGVLGLVALLVWLVIPQLWQTGKGIYDKIPTYIGQFNGWYDKLDALLANFSIDLPTFHFNAETIMAKIKELISNNSHTIIDTSVGIVTSTVGIVFDTFFAIVISIYILAQKERLGVGVKKVLYSIFSEKNTERILALSRLTEKTFSNFITGQLTEAFILGVLCFIGMLIFRIPYSGLCSVLVGVTALIPIFGAFIGTAVGAFLILFESPIKAVIFVVFIIVLQQLEGNLIYPRVVGSQVGLPGLWVLVAVSVGSEFGVLGMLVSVPLVSLAYTVVRQFADARIKAKGLEAEFPEDEPKRKMKPPKKKKEKKVKEKKGAKKDAEPSDISSDASEEKSE
ncbi:MAG: AI-2E family transporter [Clostridia bacterium]|nr:AI-2E family transporter [Clostridia bacterium]